MPTGSDLPRLARTRPAPRPGIVHLGPGAFFRSFVAPFTQEAMAAAGGDWGILAVALRHATARDALAPQGGVYTSVALTPDGPERRVVDCIADVLLLPEDPERVIAAMADPAIRIVTLTITEKGYGHVPATRALDRDRPDIAHDIAHPDAPRSAPGLIVAALARRRARATAPFTVLPCDNLSENGPLARGVVLDLARAVDPALADWIEAEGAFPASMVDRITPAMTGDDRARLAEAAGYVDAAAVHHEPFRQWVIEDRFVGGARPAWEAAGAQVVPDVAPFETMKLRCLNGAHSALAYLGSLAGHETVADAVADPAFAAYLRRLWRAEILPTLSPPEGVDLPGYCDALLDRFANPAIRHRLLQIAMDGSQKLPQRLLPPLRERLRDGAPAPCLALAVAGWMHHLATDHVEDPLAATLHGAAGDPAALLRLREVFDPDLAARADFRDAVLSGWTAIAERGPRAAVAALAQAE